MLPAQTPAASCDKHKESLPPCCRHGCSMPCCKAKQSPDSQPAPTVPPGNRDQISFLPPGATGPVALPASPIVLSSIPMPLAMGSAGLPLYAVNCARLI